MKKFFKALSVLLIFAMVLSMAGCSNDDSSSSKKRKKKHKDRDKKKIEETEEPQVVDTIPVIETEPTEVWSEPAEKAVINLWAYTDEVPRMVDKYIDLHPEFAEKYEIVVTIKPTTDGIYQPELDSALIYGGEEAPDMYCVESAFVFKYVDGSMSEYAAPYYEYGITTTDINSAGLAPYSVDIGTRDADNEVVALAYQSTGSAFIYRRSIAIDTFGTDDPAAIEEIIGAGSGDLNKFMEAAEELSKHGYVAVSGPYDIWRMFADASTDGWVVDKRLCIDPAREAYIDYAKELFDGGYTNKHAEWTMDWMTDMASDNCFGYFGPAWFIQYTLESNCSSTFGDWAICTPPMSFCWGGTWLVGNKNSSPEVKEGVAELMRWITVDTSEEGLQYFWANGMLNDVGTKDSVTSSVVMAKSNGELDILGGQDMFDVFVKCNEMVNGTNFTEYDEQLDYLWKDEVNQYLIGDLTRSEAIEEFVEYAYDWYGIPS